MFRGVASKLALVLLLLIAATVLKICDKIITITENGIETGVKK